MLPALAGEMSAEETYRTGTDFLSGYASAYAPGVFEATVRYRLDNDVWRVDPPYGWFYLAHGYAAVGDCSRVGEMTTLRAVDGREYAVLIADCAGNDGTPDWMRENAIIVELDARLWERLTAAHGRPLAVELGR
jgi:hypothetical protein